MNETTEKMLKQNAIAGAFILFLINFLGFGFSELFDKYVHVFFQLIVYFCLFIYGMYLLLPYIAYIGDSNKPWNKFK